MQLLETEETKHNEVIEEFDTIKVENERYISLSFNILEILYILISWVLFCKEC